MGCLDGIQTFLKSLKISEKIEIHFYDHFKTSWIIQNNDDGPDEPDDDDALCRLMYLEFLIQYVILLYYMHRLLELQGLLYDYIAIVTLGII